MIRKIAIVMAAGAALATSSALIAKEWVDYTPVKGFWDVTAVDVDGNHVDDYLVGLRRTQVPGFEAMRRHGLIDDYKFLVRNGYSKNSPTVVIMVHFLSQSAMEPDQARDQAIEKEIMATMSENQTKAAVAAYEKYRTILDNANYVEVKLAK